MTVSVFPNLTRKRGKSVTLKVCAVLEELKIEYYLSGALRKDLPELPGAVFLPEEELLSKTDVILSVGGDGSMIRAAKIAACASKRILGINAGNLAYLCSVNEGELHLLSALKSGDYTVQRRMLLKAELYKKDRLIVSEPVVNDVSLGRGAQIELTDIFVTADKKPIADYIGDGVIFATPTGSTAYSMSAGGPIAEPTLDAVLLTPVCPHSLFFRPFIFSPDTVFEVTKGNRLTDKKVYYSCDGEKSRCLAADCRLVIRRYETDVEFISIKTDNFIDVLNSKIIAEGRMPR